MPKPLLLEPWGCVVGAYTQRRRLEPKEGGVMWIVGRPGDTSEYTFSEGLDAPATIVLTDVPPSVEKLAAQTSANVITRNGLSSDDYAALVDELTDGEALMILWCWIRVRQRPFREIARYIARRGTVNMVGQEPLDGLVDADVGRLHYDYIAFVGNQGPDIAASYGEARNRCELQPQWRGRIYRRWWPDGPDARPARHRTAQWTHAGYRHRSE